MFKVNGHDIHGLHGLYVSPLATVDVSPLATVGLTPDQCQLYVGSDIFRHLALAFRHDKWHPTRPSAPGGGGV
jgi:hypothetical protein